MNTHDSDRFQGSSRNSDNISSKLNETTTEIEKTFSTFKEKYGQIMTNIQNFKCQK